MALSLFPALSSPINASAFSVPPLTEPSTDGYCNNFYGWWKNSLACSRAIDKLPEGRGAVTYTVDGEPGDRNLPMQVQSGDCTIQVELAGPRLPKTFAVVPQDVITMARRVQGTCVRDTSYYGGFLALEMDVLKNWVVAEETNLDAPYPTSTAFLTVTLTKTAPRWLQAGDFDPHIAWLLAQAEFAASTRAFLPRMKVYLRRRAERFMAQSSKMEPRGQRIPWWRNPAVDYVNRTSRGRKNTTGSVSPPVRGSIPTTSRRKRSQAIG